MLDTRKKLFLGIVAVFLVCELVLVNTNDALFTRATYVSAFSAAAGRNRNWFADMFTGGGGGSGKGGAGSGKEDPGEFDKETLRDLDNILYPAEMRLQSFNMYAGNYVERLNKVERVFESIRKKRK